MWLSLLKIDIVIWYLTGKFKVFYEIKEQQMYLVATKIYVQYIICVYKIPTLI